MALNLFDERVGLPVSSTLLQNCSSTKHGEPQLDYQSVRHCSKTLSASGDPVYSWITSQFDTAPKQAIERINHVNVGLPVSSTLLQNPFVAFHNDPRVGLPVSSTLLQNGSPRATNGDVLDYQSVRHCSKTLTDIDPRETRWITSQFDTAPKLPLERPPGSLRWITSQFDTAPKRMILRQLFRISWITSQFDTAPKRSMSPFRLAWVGLPVSSTLLQNQTL